MFSYGGFLKEKKNGHGLICRVKLKFSGHGVEWL